MSKVYVIESKNSLHGWSAIEAHINRNKAITELNRVKQFVRMNSIKTVFYRMRIYRSKEFTHAH